MAGPGRGQPGIADPWLGRSLPPPVRRAQSGAPGPERPARRSGTGPRRGEAAGRRVPADSPEATGGETVDMKAAGVRRILVTRASGQVGRRLVPRLAGWAGPGAVRVLVRDAGRADRLRALGVEVAVGDLREEADRRWAPADVDVDVVVNAAAALRGVPDEAAWAVNRDAAVALGREAAEAGVSRFVQVSTDLVHGRGLGRPAVEEDVPAPHPAWSAYPASKAEAGAGLRALADRSAGALPLVGGAAGDRPRGAGPAPGAVAGLGGALARRAAARRGAPRGRGAGPVAGRGRPGRRRAHLQRRGRRPAHRLGPPVPAQRPGPPVGFGSGDGGSGNGRNGVRPVGGPGVDRGGPAGAGVATGVPVGLGRGRRGRALTPAGPGPADGWRGGWQGRHGA
ncbi:hypothetical protein KSE_26915 [Kitasatospora setae KM-6054]|uniref:NAD-dependent epimerase/dehydratase domain-containing protein n=1 Tax=Kitasatospora setae (strain ATCC 33774 / DSM 43861 / JCM 3304 / KCC A-0304 / NBRC 14216 / KM-6054) TaxID=452652 RepID=E4NBC2_KITSK|nr:hypothetical protein KSE_26915 [Kitasatospora setae KM-6054]